MCQSLVILKGKDNILQKILWYYGEQFQSQELLVVKGFQLYEFLEDLRFWGL